MHNKTRKTLHYRYFLTFLLLLMMASVSAEGIWSGLDGQPQRTVNSKMQAAPGEAEGRSGTPAMLLTPTSAPAALLFEELQGKLAGTTGIQYDVKGTGEKVRMDLTLNMADGRFLDPNTRSGAFPVDLTKTGWQTIELDWHRDFGLSPEDVSNITTVGFFLFPDEQPSAPIQLANVQPLTGERQTAAAVEPRPRGGSHPYPGKIVHWIGDFETRESTPRFRTNSGATAKVQAEEGFDNQVLAVQARPGVAAVLFDQLPGVGAGATGVAFRIRGNNPGVRFDAALSIMGSGGKEQLLDPNIRSSDTPMRLDRDEWQHFYVPLAKFNATADTMQKLKSVNFFFFPEAPTTEPILLDDIALVRVEEDDVSFNPGFKDAPAQAPKLLFTDAELPALREKVRSVPALSKMYEKFRTERVSKFLEIPSDPYLQYKNKNEDGTYNFGGSGRMFHSHVLGLAFAGLIDEDQACIDKAIDLLVSAASQEGPVDIFNVNRIALNVGDMGLTYPIAYDWLNRQMTPEQRVLVKNRIYEHAAWVHYYSPESHWGKTPESESSNWSMVLHAPMGLASLLFDDHAEWREMASRKVDAYLKKSIGPDGAPSESGHYLSLGSSSAYPYITALRRLKGEDLLGPNRERLEGIPRYFAHMAVPWGGSGFDISQGSAFPDKIGWFMELSSYLKSELGYWEFYRVYGDPEEWGGRGDYAVKQHDVHKADEPFIMLAWDPSIQPRSPEQLGLPLSQFFRSGQAVARTGWDDDAAVVHFKSDEMMGGWSHADDNSFGFAAFGEHILSDPGAARYYTYQHNAVIIDGTGQAWKSPGHDVHGEITRFEDNGRFVAITGDATRAYAEFITGEPQLPVEKVLRHFYFVREPYPLVLLVDEITMQDGKPHDFAVHFQYGRRHTPGLLEIQPEELTVHSRAGATSVTATTRMLWPQEDVELRRRPDIDNLLNSVSFEKRGESVRFLTLVTTAGRDADFPTIQGEGNPEKMTIFVEYPNSTRMRMQLEGDKLKVF